MSSAIRCRRAGRRTDRDDRGSVMILVLVLMVIGSLVVLPMLSYTSSVFRAGSVQTNKAEAIELARGGTWVALNNEATLFDMCNGGALPSSLSGVTTTCDVLETVRQRPPAEMPFEAAVVQSDVVLPPAIASASTYVNPNSTSIDPNGWDDWLATPDWTPDTQIGKVWLPQLPVQATSSGGTRDTTMLPGTQDPSYASCRVFFPGTFTTPITIAEPAYFTSGVYYFTEPLMIKSGANIVVGNGASGGCTTDFEAIAAATTVPDPLNMSGIGGTFVLGGNAAIVIDDGPGGDIRFHMNQRYVSVDETSVAASSNVSIVSVNGTHDPLVAPEVLGDDLSVPGVIAVPASTVGTAGDPLAVTTGYAPSVLTPKPTEPDAPTNVTAAAFQKGSGSTRGMLTVLWDIPNENGSLITTYVATEDLTGKSCSPKPPTPPDTTVQPSCTITGLDNGWRRATVTATNAYGVSPVSAPSANTRVRLTGGAGSQAPPLTVPQAPLNFAVGTAYSDGLELVWDAPASNGGSPIVGYRVTATDLIGTQVFCEAWWDEQSCVLEVANGLIGGQLYDLDVVALHYYGAPPAEFMSPPAEIDGITTDNALPPPNPEPDPVLVTLGAGPAPVQQPAVAAVRVPEPILDFGTLSAANVSIDIAGYVSVPQGHIKLDAGIPAQKSIVMDGGVIAAQIRASGTMPATLQVFFDNPVAQKRIRIRSTSNGIYKALSDAVVQVNRSGSLAINSWIVQ